VSPTGVLYTFSHSGHVNGTVHGRSSADAWNVSGSSPAPAAGWADLEGAQASAQWSTSTDWSAIVNQLEQLYGPVKDVIEVIAS